MAIVPPFPLNKWIDEHAHLLKPPVGNAQVFDTGDFIVSVIGGPNRRTDYHDDPFEEIFFQLKGEVNIRIQEHGKVRDIPLKEGEIFLLPQHVLHSPQRPADTLGLIIELPRRKGVIEAFEWFCAKCNTQLYRGEIDMGGLDEMPGFFKAYYANTAVHTCKSCGHHNQY